ncbi:HhH-GPD-type base excision DNA repair protein [Rhodococcus sp. MEB064]|uniref:HhH-GPD-type base excision DNA repair protein n=1 Tax=Rhodococcus sp. MEB064 TaxID=1587522 RepID=UPI0005ACFAFE|nr:HhH-GPD-type base excision DNA repair protein [Rhodococcus sp. MEB064]KIQ16596.1 Fe-S cluster assembly protein HesB [Rhodococcus sp. MEB064]
MATTLHLVGDPDADALLSSEPLALLIGMLLDQQVPMESAFAGPKKLVDRIGSLDVRAIAEMPEDDFLAICSTPPAVHRYPGSMGKRIQSMCSFIVDTWDGRADAIWTEGDPDGKEVLKRLKALPGYGDQKARIFLALLGKQMGVEPTGWRDAAGSYGDDGSRRSIADVVDARSLGEVREFKKAAKKAAKESKGS